MSMSQISPPEPDILGETVMFLGDVPLHLPTAVGRPAGNDGRGGRIRVHLSTVIRWVRRGCRGVRLEAVRVGGRWVTSREALDRFVERLNQPSGSSPPIRTTHVRTRQLEKAERAAAEAGF
jgi:hypothetical protein